MVTSVLTALVLLLSFEATVIAELMCPVSTIINFAASPHFIKFSLDCGTRGTPTPSKLSLDEIKVCCDSASCVAFMDEMRAANLGDCRIRVANIRLQTDTLDAFDTNCSAIRLMGCSSNFTGKNIRDGSSSSATSSAATIAVNWIATIALIMFMLLK